MKNCSKLNPKSEIRNSKQIQMTKIRNVLSPISGEVFVLIIEFFGFMCLFRISNFGFEQGKEVFLWV